MALRCCCDRIGWALYKLYFNLSFCCYIVDRIRKRCIRCVIHFLYFVRTDLPIIHHAISIGRYNSKRNIRAIGHCSVRNLLTIHRHRHCASFSIHSCTYCDHLLYEHRFYRRITRNRQCQFGLRQIFRCTATDLPADKFMRSIRCSCKFYLSICRYCTAGWIHCDSTTRSINLSNGILIGSIGDRYSNITCNSNCRSVSINGVCTTRDIPGNTLMCHRCSREGQHIASMHRRITCHRTMDMFAIGYSVIARSIDCFDFVFRHMGSYSIPILNRPL